MPSRPWPGQHLFLSTWLGFCLGLTSVFIRVFIGICHSVSLCLPAPLERRRDAGACPPGAGRGRSSPKPCRGGRALSEVTSAEVSTFTSKYIFMQILFPHTAGLTFISSQEFVLSGFLARSLRDGRGSGICVVVPIPALPVIPACPMAISECVTRAMPPFLPPCTELP